MGATINIGDLRFAFAPRILVNLCAVYVIIFCSNNFAIGIGILAVNNIVFFNTAPISILSGSTPIFRMAVVICVS